MADDDGITMTLTLNFEVNGPHLDGIMPKIKARLEQFAPRSVWIVKTNVCEEVVAQSMAGETLTWWFAANVEARYGGPLPAGAE